SKCLSPPRRFSVCPGSQEEETSRHLPAGRQRTPSPERRSCPPVLTSRGHNREWKRVTGSSSHRRPASAHLGGDRATVAAGGEAGNGTGHRQVLDRSSRHACLMDTYGYHLLPLSRSSRGNRC